jgi:hypothetical protein
MERLCDGPFPRPGTPTKCLKDTRGRKLILNWSRPEGKEEEEETKKLEKGERKFGDTLRLQPGTSCKLSTV